MSAVPTVYRSTDPGAPVLSGTPGAFAALLDAVLVDGYGSKAPLGWVRSFSSGHKRAYRNSLAPSATGFYIRFDDAGTTSCLVSGFESMVDIDSGIGPFRPATSWPKSRLADSTPMAWVIVGTDRGVYYCLDDGQYAPSSYRSQTTWFFGDLVPLSATDVFAFGYSEYGRTEAPRYFNGVAVSGESDGRYACARSYAGMPGGVTLGNNVSLLALQQRFGASQGLAYPYPSTNGTVLSTVLVLEGSTFRARMPGVWIGEHTDVHQHNTVYSTFPDLPTGTDLLCMFACYRPGFLAPRLLIDISNPWYSP